MVFHTSFSCYVKVAYVNCVIENKFKKPKHRLSASDETYFARISKKCIFQLRGWPQIQMKHQTFSSLAEVFNILEFYLIFS